MEAAPSSGPGDTVTGLIVGDGSGRYFAIAWADLQRHRVPAAWVAVVGALVRGAEPAGWEDDLRGHSDTRTLSADHALLLEALSAGGRLRPPVQRLEAWAVLR